MCAYMADKKTLTGFLQNIYVSHFIVKIYLREKNQNPYAFLCWNILQFVEITLVENFDLYYYSDSIIV